MKDFKQLNEQLLVGSEILLSQWLPGGKVVGREYCCSNITGGPGKSLKVNTKTGEWCDFADPTYRGSDLISLYATIHGVSQVEAFDKLKGIDLKPKHKFSRQETKNQATIYAQPDFSIIIAKRHILPSSIHRYADQSGLKHPLVVCRYDLPDGRKTYRPYALNGSGYLAQNIPDNRPLYRLDELTKYPDKPVLVVEGEKAADYAQSVLKAYVVTTWAGGASAVHKADWTPLQGRDVLLWPDNDRAGRDAMRQVADILRPRASRLRQIIPDGQPDSWDAGDAFNPENPWSPQEWREWAKARLTDMPKPQDETHTDEMGRIYSKVGFMRKYQTTVAGKTTYRFEPQYKEMAEYLFEQRMMAFTDGDSFQFNGTHWDRIDKLQLDLFIIEKNPEGLKSNHMDAFTRFIRAMNHTSLMNFKPTDGLINANNGIVNVHTGELTPHSNEYLFRSKVPVDFNPKAECPKWSKFLVEVFEKNVEMIDLAQRLFGYILIGGHPFLHRAFVLAGSGRNGKSTFIDILRSLIGRDSYSTVSLAHLDRQFSAVQLEGKLANIVEETPNDTINAEVFKSVVGGGEIQVAHKNKPEFTLRVNARFVFACNEMPIFKDKSVGLEDRLVIMPFRRYFAPQERDTRILEKLTSELPGILNWAIEGAQMVLKDRNIPDYETTRETKREYKLETDPTFLWFSEYVEITPSEFLSTTDLYDAYQKWCEGNNHRALSAQKFSKRVRTFVRDEVGSNNQWLTSDLWDECKSTDRKTRGYRCLTLKGTTNAVPQTAFRQQIFSEKLSRFQD